MKAKPDQPDITQRTLEYALRAVRLFRSLQRRADGVADVVGRQYLRSATSIGANVAEAQSAESKADFVHKYGLAQKEGRESLYWLQLLRRAEVVKPSRLEPLIRETDELVSIITSIIVRAKERGEWRG